MNTKLKNLKQGFTIIEVMIVLAIAGLILAIVFFAVPQLQRNARDNQRESYTTRLKAELDTYSSNNQGTYPFTSASNNYTPCATGSGGASKTCQDFMYRYVSNGKVNIKDPSKGTDSVVSIAYDPTATSVPTAPTWDPGNVYIAVGAKCDGELPVAGGSTGTANSKQFAMFTALDRSGTWYCVDNG